MPISKIKLIEETEVFNRGTWIKKTKLQLILEMKLFFPRQL